MLASANSRFSAGPYARKHPAQRRSIETVAAILEAATHIFERRGFAHATTNHVAARAGVSIGSLYQYFPNKEALAAALEERHLTEVAPALLLLARDLRTRQATPAAWAGAFARAVVAQNDRPIHLALYGVTPRTPMIQARLERIVDAIARELVPLLHGQRRRLRARVAVVTVVSLVHELVIPMTGRGRASSIREVVALAAAYLGVRPGARSRVRAPPRSRRSDQGAHKPP